MTAKRKIRVLVVDDSSFMRKAIQSMLEEDPAIEVAGLARDGAEAVEKVDSLRPDVVTMDIEMPRMNGLDALSAIMRNTPLPVLMLSSLTEDGANATFDALEIGAVDYIPKHLGELSCNIMRVKYELIAKIKAAAKIDVKNRPASRKASYKLHPPVVPQGIEKKFVSQKIAIVAIGASTGGPNALQHLLSMLPHNFTTGILIVLHMPKNFTGPYAERLNGICELEVKEAACGDVMGPGGVFIAPGGRQTRLKRRGAIDVYLSVDDDPPDVIYKPSVDVSFVSVAACFPGRALGVIMTGMGQDGVEGIRAIKKTGGKVVAQDEASCVVYGMPKAVVAEGLADKVTPLDSMAGEIVNMV